MQAQTNVERSESGERAGMVNFRKLAIAVQAEVAGREMAVEGNQAGRELSPGSSRKATRQMRFRIDQVQPTARFCLWSCLYKAGKVNPLNNFDRQRGRLMKGAA